MINFKDRIKKGIQQQQQQPQQSTAWTKQNKNLVKDASRKDLYRQVTNQLSSQQFEAGDFRKPDINTIPSGRRRNSSILEAEHQQEIQQPIQILQYGNSNNQRSLLNSNVVENYNGSLFESKLHETKGELSEQIYDLQKRIKKQIERDRDLIGDYVSKLFNKYAEKYFQKFNEKSKEEQRKNFEIIVSQLNRNLNVTSKKQKNLQSGLTQNQQKLDALQKLFTQFTSETEQKMQRIINKNSDIASSSMKKSLSRNMGTGEYVLELKNSIKDIPVQSNALVQQITSQIHQIQETIKNLKYEFMHIKQDFKNKTIAPSEQQKIKTDYVQAARINIIQQEINNLKTYVDSLNSKQDSNYYELRGVLKIQEQNYSGMNQTFKEVLNASVIPRIKKVEDQIASQSIQRNCEVIKKQVVKQLQSMPIIRVKPLSEQEKQKLQRMKSASKGQQAIYMLDDLNFILDCFGNYLLDQNNQRVKLEEDQIYYLQQIEGIQMKSLFAGGK